MDSELSRTHGKAREAAQREARTAERLAVQAQVREATEQGRERDLRLGPGQRGTEAEVDAAAEGQRLDVGTRHVQAIGIGIALGVAVAGTEDGDDGEGEGGAAIAKPNLDHDSRLLANENVSENIAVGAREGHAIEVAVGPSFVRPDVRQGRRILRMASKTAASAATPSVSLENRSDGSGRAAGIWPP